MTEYKGIIETVIIALALIGTIIYLRSNAPPLPGWEKKNQCKIMLAVEILSLVIALKESFLSNGNPMILDRNDAGGGNTAVERVLTAEGIVEGYDLEIQVPERVLTSEELDAAFLEAQREIEEGFLGENKDYDHISSDIVMGDVYADGLITAAWQLGSYEYVESTGRVKAEELTEPVANTASVTLTYSSGDTTQSQIYEFAFCMVPPDKTPIEKFIAGVQEQISYSLDDSRTMDTAPLPQSYGGSSLSWQIRRKTNGILVFILGIVVVVGIGIGQKADEKKKQENRRAQLGLEYSEVLSVMSLLLGAGMSVKRAWEKMVQNYFARNGPRNEAYEEMAISLRQMNDGASETVAVESFGRRCGLPEYKKFAGILVNYMKKGSRGITEQLSAEVTLAFEERKSLAKIAGEQAGTKLLVPMIMLLGVTLVIIIVPALLSFSF